MKKLGAILILGVMLFNGFGYRIVANYFDQKAAEHFVAIIDENDYNEADLVTIKTFRWGNCCANLMATVNPAIPEPKIK